MPVRLTIAGVYEGFAESKSEPGLYYTHISLPVPPPSGLLKTIRVNRPFGAPLQGLQKLGGFALITTKDKLSSFSIGEKVVAQATYWPVSVPYWSEKKVNIAYQNGSKPVYILDGQLKKHDGALRPVNAHIAGSLHSAQRHDDKGVTAVVGIDEQPPAGVLTLRSVQKGKHGFMQAEEQLGTLSVRALANMIPSVPPGTGVTFEAQLWPVREPFYSKETDTLDWRTVPDAVLIASTNLAPEKQKA